MTSLLEPSPLVLAFLFVKRFVAVEAIVLLALVRMVTGRGKARVAAALSVVLGLAAILSVFAPALGLASGAWYGPAARLLNLWNGMAVPLAVSAPLVLSAALPGARLRVIDWLHAALLLGLVGLWLAVAAG